MDVQLLECINDGGFADIWSAKDELGRDVAVKIVRASAAVISDAEAHACALARAAHKNVVTVHSIETITDPLTGNETKGIVMELLKGDTIEKRLRGRMLKKEDVAGIGKGLLDGLTHIHNIGLSHGDLHAGNVILTTDEKVKIIDILYTDSLAQLSSGSRQKRVERDSRNARMLLQDLMINSDVDVMSLNRYGDGLSLNSTLEEIRVAFDNAMSVVPVSEAQVDFHYNRFDDEAFVKGEEYANALSDETPDGVILPLLLRAIDSRRMTADRYDYVENLWNRLSDVQRASVLEALSTALDKEIPGGRFAPLFRLVKAFGVAQWKNLNRLVRIRAEAAIANDILKGRLDYYAGSKITGGHLGTWARTFGRHFSNKSEIIEAIATLLHNNWYSQNYVGYYFISDLPSLAKTEDQRTSLLSGLQAAIGNNAFIIKQNLVELPREWQEALKS